MQTREGGARWLSSVDLNNCAVYAGAYEELGRVRIGAGKCPVLDEGVRPP